MRDVHQRPYRPRMDGAGQKRYPMRLSSGGTRPPQSLYPQNRLQNRLCARSSMDRVLPSEGRGCWFDPSRARQFSSAVPCSVRTPAGPL
ncbi:protein of unknown function [Cupriavidus neocaledonicus]|uniref:Uncharacterized protein n=1 Tax=Cupriavidus neocaledonicus TaxID=1040979 RepID=A0A375HC82_9BURK|nr:hypothetical protein CBM2605_A290010 [Cupriavidus neocaledonicus]SPD48498.1 protein of unknown function [Cupriavidus neocaledonicus]